ncbi:zinc ABC transporter substrate-binding protein [Anabaena cylindrica FACHB-243]|uniref:ABC-type metal ion transporter, periplasmic subunit n=1 Tax=Anabaena cylindrica (strain ATCC 27899 / PCC 7122) TaxID=272123 RepID=K9ZCL6_ANACC|nr:MULTISPECIES: zinc ABC transporter substrate-binding protein [Anabaena]AFZ56921.1 ABC-type metal ion transporter, periplasmic subunit [Anabaena cylindrica PCC 7122]MBD2418413.1 zinc ABC transporter substrate-binding protein [Anabaena cylindrica FACHB-243]MBY5284360.1 zinc ABC transporter solute-binding protein [Anabaena sp. CCAP 1446/1C]MBY5307635.1 zinc ABC transporter solute-binding protein [Anabaena sp. CCAP 1446/1C]MCM2409404.1 zinc ABC transporter substrate-binding protein [Anabaena sp
MTSTGIKLRRNSPKRQILLVMTLFILSIASGCSQSRNNTDKRAEEPSVKQLEKTKVVTTFLPVYLFTKAIAGDVADVAILVPPGIDIHDYQATPDNVKAIATANVLVKNGLGLETFLTDTVKNAQNPQLVEIDASKSIKVINDISPVEEIKDHDHDHKHEHEKGNPHVWLDPVFAKQQVINIRDGLITADPVNKEAYQTNAAAYIQELDNLNNEFQQTLQQTPNCTFITFHDAFPYLATRYNLKQVAVVEIPEDQLSPADVQKAINAVKKYKVKALFSEPGVDNKLLTSLSQDLKLTLYPLNSLENGDTNPQYYFQAMKTNLQNLSTGCR